jgi:DNA-binding SARP family transcriptional activator
VDGIPPHATYSQQVRRCGKLECNCCRPGNPGHGPYWYARWQENGRTRSRYLGKVLPSRGEDYSPSPYPMPEGSGALRVRTLGSFTVWRGIQAIPERRWARRTVSALFTCLLSAPRQSLDRAQAIDLLWPLISFGRGAVNLRTVVHRLRAVLDGPGVNWRLAGSYLRTEGSLLVLDPLPGGAPPSGWLDAVAFDHAATAALTGPNIAACEEALALYGGDYLAADLYSDWVVGRREQLRGQYQNLLWRLGQLYTAAGVLEQAISPLRRLLAADPSREEATRLLMWILGRTGERIEALRVYAALERALYADLGVGVMPETTMLRQAIARGLIADPAPWRAPGQYQPAAAVRPQVEHQSPSTT